MKLRLLNASHQVLGHLGVLAGHRWVHEACEDPLFASLLMRYMEGEAAPTLRPVPGVDLGGYQHELLRRFGNPGIADTLARLCADTSDRIPKFLLPVARENLAAGRSIKVVATAVAAWARYAGGVDDQGRPIQVVDRLREPLMAAARRWRSDPAAFLRRDLFGDLADDPRFVQEYTAALVALHDRGARAVIAELVPAAGGRG